MSLNTPFVYKDMSIFSYTYMYNRLSYYVLQVTVYNPLGWQVREPIRIPVDDAKYEVFGPDGKQCYEF